MSDDERHKEDIALVRRWRSEGYFEGAKLAGGLVCLRMGVCLVVDDVARVEIQPRGVQVDAIGRVRY